eukprot:TRINITY_DN49214_c0_g1_i1.p1 TRINITY_DN49214_c0_g1~~TRINITY_DN49214_c0_g1_i1.p1  ORF type:complete len:665 (-),score=70.40 TRINITY_DN49214_c0_g1_i1:231-2225(-)
MSGTSSGGSRDPKGSHAASGHVGQRETERCSIAWFSAVVLIGSRLVDAQSQYFETLPYRDPTQCERNQCLSVRLPYCREHLEGFYLLEKACEGGQICTDCAYGNKSTAPAICRCENPPFSITVGYGEECNAGKVCAPGVGECYRPCYTYVHSTMCPTGHCMWDNKNFLCVSKPPPIVNPLWSQSDHIPSVVGQADHILDNTDPGSYPIDFVHFKASAHGYRIRGKLLDNVTMLETIFLNLDRSNDGLLQKEEYAVLPNILSTIDAAIAADEGFDDSNNSAGPQAQTARARQLQGTDEPSPTPEVCGSQFPRKYYCSFDVSCKEDCKECGWKSATDEAFSTCVRPTPSACRADGKQVYCISDDSCHPPGDCSRCVDRPVIDYSQSQCLAMWWNSTPLDSWTDWVCRYRSKNGMPCRHDQDCVYGLRRCLNGKCAPKQPYNAAHLCDNDYDCPHLNHFCPKDPTGDKNPYWIQYCRRQREEGATCSEDRECQPVSRCNLAEPQPRCRRLFSLPDGSIAYDDLFCSSGWRDRNNKCATPARSKEAGRSCDNDRRCATTDQTGRTGRCVCKAWWDTDDAKYCEPVAGDYARHQEKLRDWVWFRTSNCGHFWTEEDCLSVFGNEALKLRLAWECETQELSGGPYLPPPDCGIVDEARFPDPCARLKSLR